MLKHVLEQVQLVAHKLLCTSIVETMFCAAMTLLLWFASMNTLSYKGHRISVSAEAESETDVAQPNARCESDPVDLGQLDEGNGSQIFALVSVERITAYHSMMKLSADAKRQVRFWQLITGKTLHGEAFIFHINKVAPLERSVDVQQFERRHVRSFVAMLKSDQPPRLWDSIHLAASDSGNDWFGPRENDPPTCFLRVPLPYIRKVLGGDWKEFVLPHLPN